MPLTFSPAAPNHYVLKRDGAPIATVFFQRYVERFTHQGFRGRNVSVRGHFVDAATGIKYDLTKHASRWAEARAYVAAFYA